MDLFKRLFTKIKDVDTQRLIEEQKLTVRVDENKKVIEDLCNSIEI